VVITPVYAHVTLLLWRATRTQAEITRLTFEAGHRPYVSATVQEPMQRNVHGRLPFSVVVNKHGSVPAAITEWTEAVTPKDRLHFPLAEKKL
jgi:hypothetical protein